MTTTYLIALVLLLAVGARYLLPRAERCPDCHAIRDDETPICRCGWIFDVPDDDTPLEYGEDDDF